MKDYKQTTIELTIEEEISLAVLIHKDGTVNRKGDGTINIDHSLFMGIEDGLFDKLIAIVDDEFEQYLGTGLDRDVKEGKSCTLEITLSDETTTLTTKFLHGSDSVGVPLVIANYVSKAIEITDKWYYENINKLNKKRKRWWELWK